MNKKKHQGEPNGDESSESCDENLNSCECNHVNRAVDLSKIKKGIIKTGFLKDCEDCKKLPADHDEDDMDEGIAYDLSLWMCLKCGNQACGRSRNKHALSHFRKPHSDSHAMCVNTTIWSVWCYDCDNEINVSCKKKLMEAVDYLKKCSDNQSSKQISSLPPIVADWVTSGVSNVLSIDNSFMNAGTSTGATRKITSSLFDIQPETNGLPRARGLSNLGNTCFFNSVMQCLGQTPYLLTLLEETSKAGQHFHLPGGKLQIKDTKDVIELEPLEGVLEEWKPLTSALAVTLRELQSGRPEVYIPKQLLIRLTRRMPQFGGGDQHDSHELLRHLLEAVREEDLKRYKTIILEKLGLNSKTDPATVEGEKKQIIKFYGQQASEMLLPTEQVFRGVLVSTLQCQICGHTSHRDEFFLDLSLPISEKQLPPALRRKAEEIEDNKPSKHQIKKEKRAERKKNKKQKSHRNLTNNLSNNRMDDSFDTFIDKSESESDADVEDNAEESSNNAQVNEEQTKGMESGYNSDKIDNSSPDSNNRGGGCSPDMRVDDSGVPSPIVGMLSVSPASPESSPASSETNVDMGSPLCGHNSPNDEMEEFERPGSRLAFVNNKNSDLKEDLAKLSLLNDSESNRVNSMYVEMVDEAYGIIEQPTDEKMEEDEDEDEDSNLWTGTMSARYQCEEGECSVQSCLNQFTECELLAGTNKVSCESCTQRYDGPEKKTIYRDASKQLLIYNPPAVLILHLKRFQVYRYRSAKVSKFVKFSTELDLAPFCSKRSQNLPTFEAGQTKVLYSLYGVVEHSGSMHGGHYVAYVKVRPKLDDSSYRWQFLPKNQNNKVGGGSTASGEPQMPTGKWYYISDTYVSEVPESKVLDAQAYLLFYERIM